MNGLLSDCFESQTESSISKGFVLKKTKDDHVKSFQLVY